MDILSGASLLPQYIFLIQFFILSGVPKYITRACTCEFESKVKTHGKRNSPLQMSHDASTHVDDSVAFKLLQKCL